MRAMMAFYVARQRAAARERRRAGGDHARRAAGRSTSATCRRRCRQRRRPPRRRSSSFPMTGSTSTTTWRRSSAICIRRALERTRGNRNKAAEVLRIKRTTLVEKLKRLGWSRPLMPPRFAYWTILVGGLPTAFRAAERDELLPTFKRLQEKHPDAEMRWFARGQLWESPEAAREALDAAPAASDRPRGRDRDWRPGGAHRDPRQTYIDAKKARNVERRKQRFEHRQQGDGPAPTGPADVRSPRRAGPDGRNVSGRSGRPRRQAETAKPRSWAGPAAARGPRPMEADAKSRTRPGPSPPVLSRQGAPSGPKPAGPASKGRAWSPKPRGPESKGSAIGSEVPKAARVERPAAEPKPAGPDPRAGHPVRNPRGRARKAARRAAEAEGAAEAGENAGRGPKPEGRSERPERPRPDGPPVRDPARPSRSATAADRGPRAPAGRRATGPPRARSADGRPRRPVHGRSRRSRAAARERLVDGVRSGDPRDSRDPRARTSAGA